MNKINSELPTYYNEVFKPRYNLDATVESLKTDQLESLKGSMGFAVWKIDRAKKQVVDEIQQTKLSKALMALATWAIRIFNK